MGACRLFFVVTFFLLIQTFSPLSSTAQTIDEWTRQKRTQIRYLLKQIAGLKIYAELVHDGYTIAHDGLGLISNIKEGDLHLHSSFFSSLQHCNPEFKKLVQYDGPCRDELVLLLADGYYQLSDDERLSRLRSIIFNCKP